EAPEDRVDEALRARRADERGRLDGRGHRGVRRDPRFLELIETDPKERGEVALLRIELGRRELADLPLEPVMPAERALHERLEERSVARSDRRSRERRVERLRAARDSSHGRGGGRPNRG